MSTTYKFKSLPVTVAPSKKFLLVPKGTPKPEKKTERIAKKVFRSEKKAHEVRKVLGSSTMVTNVLANSFVTAHLSDIVKGDALFNRTANDIIINYVHFRLSAANNSVVKTRLLRVMIVKERNARGTTLDTTTWTNLFENEAFNDFTATALQGDAIVPLNRDVVDPIYDKTYKLIPEYNNGLFVQKKLRINRKISYEVDSNDIINGRLYMIAHILEQDNIAVGTGAVVDCLARVFFKNV